jgi:hypothetical protein
MDSQKKSTVAWSADKASLKITSKLAIGDGGEMTITEVYRMNGASVVLETIASSSYGDLSESAHYDKK